MSYRVFLLLGLLCGQLPAQAFTAAQRARIDSAATAVLRDTEAPSASVAVVVGGRIVYEQAYGQARVTPPTPASPRMRYSIGSVSKQFTAAALLLLAEEGKLSLDDRVSKWVPTVTRAGDVSLRQLLTMTAGYQDYWPQDYVIPAMTRPTAPQGVLDRWARQPLDFEPGAQWQYSNTSYIIAGLIVEKASGRPLFEFLRERIFTPLKMTSVADVDAAPLAADDAERLLRHALGPLRAAPKEAKGWLFAAGGLAMTAHDLALWDISMIDRSVLKPASYAEMQTPARLSTGASTGYGLGVNVGTVNGHRRVAHSGAVSGFVTANRVFPDDRAAIVVFVNIYPGAGSPAADLATRITTVLFPPPVATQQSAAPAQPPAAPSAEVVRATQRIRAAFVELQNGRIDRARFTANGNAYFTAETLADFASSLRSLGAPTTFEQTSESLRGGFVYRSFEARCGTRTLSVDTFSLPDGTIEQIVVGPG